MVTMAERIAKVEEQTKAIPRIESKLDAFIEKSDCTYATKEEVRLQVDAIRQKNILQDKDINWSKEKIWELFYKVAVLLSILAFILKQYSII